MSAGEGHCYWSAPSGPPQPSEDVHRRQHLKLELSGLRQKILDIKGPNGMCLSVDGRFEHHFIVGVARTRTPQKIWAHGHEECRHTIQEDAHILHGHPGSLAANTAGFACTHLPLKKLGIPR